MMETDFPLLSLMIFSLPLGAVLIWLVRDEQLARWIGLGTVLLDLLLAAGVVWRFDTSRSGFQLVERHDWISSLPIQYSVGVDGISVLFLPFTVLLFVGVILAGWRNVRSMPRLYYSLLLLLESATLGIFCSLNTILFFLFWELTLVPIYFLISLWGIGPNRRYAAVKYTLIMLAGGVPLLFGILLLAFNQAAVSGITVPAGLVFDYVQLLNSPLPAEMQSVIFLLLLLGFAVKMPLFPLHTWLPTLAMEGPIAIAAVMTGLKLGVYGLIRFVIPLAPDAARNFDWLLLGLGVVGVIYGALLAMSQTNLRRMLAYFSISHVGLVVLGVASFTLQGIQGAVFQLLNFSFVAGGLFLLTGWLQRRAGSTDVLSLGGAARSLPLLASFYLLFGLAALGLPVTSGFPAELMLILGVLKSHLGVGLAGLLGVVLGAACFLGLYRRAFMGPLHNVVLKNAQDLRGQELLVSSVFALLVLGLGIYPEAILQVIRLATENWITRVSPIVF